MRERICYCVDFAQKWDRITDRDGVLYRRITMPNCDNERSRADDDWVEKHQRRLRDAHRMARVHLQQHADDRKQRYDRRAGDLPLAVGDRVYLRNRQVRGRNKIQDVWDSAVYNSVFYIEPVRRPQADNFQPGLATLLLAGPTGRQLFV